MATRVSSRASFGMSFSGNKTLERHFKKSGKEASQVLHESLLIAAKNTLRGALSRVPIRFGHLKRSGRLDIFTNPTSPNQIIEVSFGKNPFVRYALFVHDKLADHRSGKRIIHKGRTQAYYLSQPFEREARNIQKYWLARIRKITTIPRATIGTL